MTKTKRILILSFGLLTFALISFSFQKQKKESVKTPESSLLWKISGNGLTQSSYLFGTIHLICKEDYLWTPAMENAFEQCSQVAFELNLQDPTLATKVQMGMMLPPNKSLGDFVSPTDYRKIVNYAKDSLGLPELVSGRLKPFALLTLASIQGSNPCKGGTIAYEEQLTKEAQKSNKSFAGLETAEEQLAIFDKMNTDSTIRQLLDLVNNPHKTEEQLTDLTSAYLKQNLDTLQYLITQSSGMQGDLNTMLYNRNKNWVPKIETLIKDKPTFIAVGAGHLGGDKGVIELLKQAGFTVTPVR